MNEQTNILATQELKERWGGNLPTWEEYKKAYKNGRVRANKTVAAQAIHFVGIPKIYTILYGIVTIWLGFLIFPLTLIVWFFMKFNWLWILGSLIAAWFFIKISREGHCEGMKLGAYRDEKLFDALVCNGAFLFGPAPHDK